VRLGEIRSIEKYNDLIENQTHDLPACSIVHQQITLQRESDKIFKAVPTIQCPLYTV
jgi:hypothetical protein